MEHSDDDGHNNEGLTSLSQEGIHLLMNEISLASCKSAIEFILNHNIQQQHPKQLSLMICSNGGAVDAAFALIDVIKGSKIPVHTIGLGQIASAGLMIFIAGAKGHRRLTPNTSILSHQYSWGANGKEHELFARIREYELTTERMINHYKNCTGLGKTIIRDKLLPPEDKWLSSTEALELGLCDEVKNLG